MTDERLRRLTAPGTLALMVLSVSTMLVDEEAEEGREVRSMLDEKQSDELPPQPLLLLVDEEEDFMVVPAQLLALAA